MKNRSVFGVFLCVLTLILASFALICAPLVRGVDERNANEDYGAMRIFGDDKERYTVLVLGRDMAASLCDVMMLASIDLGSGDVTLLQIPRDTYFNCSAGDHKRINAAAATLGGASELKRELSDAMGIEIDNYFSFDMDTVARIVDLMSGVELEVPVDMDHEDPASGLSIHLGAGHKRLNGAEAVQFLRYRSGYIEGDLGRMDAQKLFLNAFIKRMGALRDPIALINIFKTVCSRADTDISERELISLGLGLAHLSDGEVSFMSAPGKAIRSDESGAWYYVLSRSGMQRALAVGFGISENTIFDKNEKFVDKERRSFYDIYDSWCEPRVYRTQDIDDGKLIINKIGE